MRENAVMAKTGPTSVLAAARNQTIDDVIDSATTLLFCGINPGLWSAARNQHFARPGNRFWPVLHRSGFTPTLLGPERQRDVLRYGLGLTNLVARATAGADELTAAELRHGATVLAAKIDQHRPAWLAIVGIGAYRTAFARPKAVIGRQREPVGATQVWVVPNPSGLNAHYPLERLVIEFSRLRVEIEPRSLSTK